jgi:hypothetical protein
MGPVTGPVVTGQTLSLVISQPGLFRKALGVDHQCSFFDLLSCPVTVVVVFAMV